MARAQRPNQCRGRAEADRDPENADREGVRSLIDVLPGFAELYLPAERGMPGCHAHRRPGDQYGRTAGQPLKPRGARWFDGRRFGGRPRFARPGSDRTRVDRGRFLKRDSLPSFAEQGVRPDQHVRGAVQHQSLRRAARVQCVVQTLHILRRPMPVQMRRDYRHDPSGSIRNGCG